MCEIGRLPRAGIVLTRRRAPVQEQPMPSTGIVCGARSLPKHEVEEQSRRIARGLAAFGVRQAIALRF